MSPSSNLLHFCNYEKPSRNFNLLSSSSPSSPQKLHTSSSPTSLQQPSQAHTSKASYQSQYAVARDKGAAPTSFILKQQKRRELKCDKQRRGSKRNRRQFRFRIEGRKLNSFIFVKFWVVRARSKRFRISCAVFVVSVPI